MKPAARTLLVFTGLGMAVFLPFFAVVPVVRHLLMALDPHHAEQAAGVTGSTTLAMLLILVVAIPPLLLMRSMIAGAIALRGIERRLQQVAEGRISGVPFRVIRGEAVVLFVAGPLRPRIYVSEAALASLSPEALRAGIFHERAHQLRGDVASRFALHAVASAFRWLTGVNRLVNALTLRSEAAADRLALDSGASRRGLFDAIVAASAAAGSNPAAGGTAVETRLRLIAGSADSEPRSGVPLVLALGLILTSPAGAAQLLAMVAPYCGPP